MNTRSEALDGKGGEKVEARIRASKSCDYEENKNIAIPRILSRGIRQFGSIWISGIPNR